MRQWCNRRILAWSQVFRHSQTPSRLQARQFTASANMTSITSPSALLYATVTSPATAAAEPEDAKELKHHLKGRVGFTNPWPSFIELSVPYLLRTMLWRRLTGKGGTPDVTPPTVPVHKPAFLQTRETPSLRATWLGHASFYIEFPGGFKALTDPVYTDRCSPMSFAGPRRYTDIPCQIDDIPYIDAVIISHNHYDHLSHPTIMRIKNKYPNVHFFAPLGNKKWFTDCGITNMTELDWWQQREITLTPASQPTPGANGDTEAKPMVQPTTDISTPITATISCLPCQHLSARGPFDKCHTLWASWSVHSGGKSVFFGGDTAYRAVPPSVSEDHCDTYTPEVHGQFPSCPAFKQIGQHRGPFDLGLIPIGAYKPRFIMSAMHANPFDSVNIFKDTKCKAALGMHWGTWVLTEEAVLDPPVVLKRALEANNLPQTGVFDVCDIGESREFP